MIQRETLEQHLNAVGITQWGVLTGESLAQEAQRLRAWLEAGHHADMDWMPRHADKRVTPALLWEGVQSVVVVAVNYFPGWKAGQGEGLKIARYALGKDYHKVIRRHLGKVLKALQAEYTNLEGRPFVDSAPLLEKALAVQAGLGWQGKHSLLITKEWGSWVMIGTLFLNQAVEAYTPPLGNHLETGHCGSCTRCITACPTQAIVAPTVVDSRRCIAYWTIENAEADLPPLIQANQEGWIFGCDICQEVCPWNLKFSSVTEEPAFVPRASLHDPSVSFLKGLTPESFEIAMQASPLRRTGLKRLHRNIDALDDAVKYNKAVTK